LPPSTLAVGYGFNIVNQTTLATGRISYFLFPSMLKMASGYIFRQRSPLTVISSRSTIRRPLPCSLMSCTWSLAPNSLREVPTPGSWVFGPYQDQLAYVKDVAVHSRNGTLLYHNAMKNESVLEECDVSTNSAPSASMARKAIDSFGVAISRTPSALLVPAQTVPT
jgi:hypothetical protein